MLTSKQRAYLRGMANSFEPVHWVGKEGIGENTIKTVSQALEARELIKCAVLETAPDDCRKTAHDIAEKVGADVVQVIGRKFILYKPSSDKEKRKISLKGI